MKYVFLVIILVVLGACSSVSSVISGDKMNLEKTEWVLEDNNLNPVNEITLGIEEGRIFGNASCNNYFGGVEIDANTGHFSVGNLGLTRKACHKMSAEHYFMSVLDKVNKYKINQGSLELYQDNVLLLKFKKK